MSYVNSVARQPVERMHMVGWSGSWLRIPVGAKQLTGCPVEHLTTHALRIQGGRRLPCFST
eukprot:15432069-Alexandrium_andersonii.AAC.1